ncbi:MAG: methyltransferase domain-containing protein [Cyanobacteria bacterium SZAS LIN-5]|nr:methyltransferase domain-containing protein [Cyanobacteria bacterium SZAS LIN-5]
MVPAADSLKLAGELLMNMTMLKQAINKSFSQQAPSYALHADAQKRSADLLAQFIRERMSDLPRGEILEIGCGTGIFTTHLLSLFGEENIAVSDASAAMLRQCEEAIAPVPARVKLLTLDAENAAVGTTNYSLIVSSFSLQWMSDFFAALQHLLAQLKPDGELIFSIPLNGSFREWREQCAQTGIPFTANRLPDRIELTDWCRRQALTLDWEQHPVVCKYNSSLEFFRSLKRVGASVNTNGDLLKPNQLRELIRTWDEANQICSGSASASASGSASSSDSGSDADRIAITYQVLCARISRRYDR